MRILLVEDDNDLSSWLARLLRKHNLVVDCVGDGEDADAALSAQSYALVVLDLGLPGLGGVEVLRRLRRRNRQIPVLILTANDAISSRVSGLDAGADDYLVKPFDVQELLARIRAQLRRASGAQVAALRCGSLAFNSTTREFTLADHPLTLTFREHGVLEALLRNAGRAVSKAQLVETVFGFNEEATQCAIEIHVHRLRKKIEGSGVAITTLRGLGYVLRTDKGVLDARKEPSR